MNKYLEQILKRSPSLNSPLEKAIAALWLLDNDEVTKESETANQAALDLLDLQQKITTSTPARADRNRRITMLPDREAINNRNALKAKRYNEMLVVNKSQHAEITALREALDEIATFQNDKDNKWMDENHGETARFMRQVARQALKGATK